MQRDVTNNKRMIGTFLLSHDPHVVTVAAAAGIDVVFLDFEHGTYSVELASRFIDVARGARISVFARCTIKDVPNMARLFDHGLDGILVAGATTTDEIETVIQTLKFPPRGKRGFNPLVPAAQYGLASGDDFTHQSDAQTSIWVLVENRQLLNQIPLLTKIEGMNGVFFGPYDLSVDLGVPGEVQSQAVQKTLQNGIGKVQRAGLPAGIFSKDVVAAKPWLDLGVQLLVVGADWLNLQVVWTQTVQSIRQA